MTKLNELQPGDLVANPLGKDILYISQILPHPIYPTLSLAIWQLPDGKLSFDALSPKQEIGEARISSYDQRTLRLKNFFHGGQGQ